MYSSRETRHCLIFLLIFIVLINVVSLDARRSWGSSSRSRSSSSGSGRVSRPVHIPRTPVYVPKPPSRPHIPPSVPHTPHNSGSNSGKESSNIFIHSEGGGRPRPGSTVNDHKQQSTPHQPSAPNEPINKVTVGNVHSQGNPHGSSSGSSYPSWANPGAASHGGTNPHAPFPSQPHGSTFPNGLSNPSQTKPTGPLTSAPYPPIHPPGPISHQPIIPSHQPSQSVGAPHGSYPYPNSPHGMPAPYPPSAPYPGSHPPGMPMPNAPHIGFGNGGHTGGVHQPIGSPHSYPSVGSSPMQPHVGAPHSTVIHNHYNAPPIGSPQNPAGHPNYVNQPVYGGAPMSQPFVPGQTTIFLPSQQSSGPGFGQLVKEALVFSTVNAGVNRLINGPTHHHHDNYQPSQPAAPAAPGSATPTVTNTIIYNNQYGPPNPNGSGTAQVPGVATVPGSTAAGQPSVTSGSQPPFPGTPPSSNTNFPAGTAVSNPSIGTPSSGVSSAGSQYPNPPPPLGTSGTAQINVPPGNTRQNGNDQPTSVTTNNTNNQTSPPAFQYYISNEELWNLTEILFTKDEFNASEFITLNLQNRVVDNNDTDVSPAPLLYVQWEAYNIPTIKTLREIYDNYEYDSNKKESINEETRRKENIMLDAFLGTNIMNTAMTWLSEKGYIEPDSFEWKDTLRHIWMSKVNGATSGFERIFLAEKYDGPSILGGQNWVFFNHQESNRLINYMGYVDKIDLGRKSHLVKINLKIDDTVKPNTTMLIGTPPELEMALYTICYYARPNDVCNVSLGGVKFNIYTHPFRYFGKDLIDLGLIFF